MKTTTEISDPRKSQPIYFPPGHMEGNTLYLGILPSWGIKYASVDGGYHANAEDCAKANEIYWRERGE